MKKPGEFWEQSEQVEKFAVREPDERLRDLVEAFEAPERTRILDLGCAGGRNTDFLARRGFDVYAVDASTAMVSRTRRRMAEVRDEAEAERRVRVGRMEDLARFGAAMFDLVVALGVYHNAADHPDWRRALEETARVLRTGGRLLVATFAPGTDLTGEGMRRVEGTRHVYEGGPSGPLYLVDRETLDAEMARCGLVPVVPTETVEVETDAGRRVTVNGLYRRIPGSPSR
ncbi:MAG: class I SAM-dependent methyltransferase [Gemmatimonadota bacterium]